MFRLLALTEASSRTADGTRTLLIPTSAFRVCVHAEICLVLTQSDLIITNLILNTDSDSPDSTVYLEGGPELQSC